MSEQKRFTFRIPTDLFDKIDHLATQNHRSTNSEIIIAIEQYLKTCQRDKQQP